MAFSMPRIPNGKLPGIDGVDGGSDVGRHQQRIAHRAYADIHPPGRRLLVGNVYLPPGLAVVRIVHHVSYHANHGPPWLFGIRNPDALSQGRLSMPISLRRAVADQHHRKSIRPVAIVQKTAGPQGYARGGEILGLATWYMALGSLPGSTGRPSMEKVRQLECSL